MRTPVVLVVRKSDRFSAVVSEKGYRVLNLELIRTELFEDQKELDGLLENGNRYDGLFITSAAAAEVLAGRRRAFKGEVYVLGKRAKEVLKEAGLEIRHSESANTAGELIRSFDTDEFAGKSFLYLRGDRSLRVIPEALRHIARVDEAVVYRTIEVAPDVNQVEDVRARLRCGEIGWICVFSPSGVTGLVNLLGQESVCRVPLAVIGETTAEAARNSGLDVAFVATNPGAEEFAKSFLEYLKTLD